MLDFVLLAADQSLAMQSVPRETSNILLIDAGTACVEDASTQSQTHFIFTVGVELKYVRSGVTFGRLLKTWETALKEQLLIE